MMRTDVVTAFLQRSDGRILLARRSQDVRTYSGLWAGISGYLETTDPLLQAKTEIQEETGLDRSQVELRRRGYPLAVDDESNDHFWRVHPFRFSISPESTTIELDHEHREYGWYDPDEIETLETVPGLIPCWKRVSNG